MAIPNPAVVKGKTQVTFTDKSTALKMKIVDGKNVATPVYYKVWAYNTVGPIDTSLTSAKVSVTATLVKAPDAPADLSQDTTVDYSASSIKIKFTKPTEDAADKIVAFDVQNRVSGTDTWSASESLGADAVDATVSVDAAGKYEIRVRAKTALYTGAWSTIEGIAAVAPAPPTLDAQTVFSATQVTLNWTPGNNGGLDITKYMIYIDTVKGTTDTAFAADKLVHTTLGP